MEFVKIKVRKDDQERKQVQLTTVKQSCFILTFPL